MLAAVESVCVRIMAEGTLADFGTPTRISIRDNIAFCTFSLGNGRTHGGYVCAVKDMKQDLFRGDYLAAKGHLGWSLRMYKWMKIAANEIAADPYKKMLDVLPIGDEKIFLCSYEQPNNGERHHGPVAALDAKTRISLLFQYIFALHQIYTLFGVQSVASKFHIIQRKVGVSTSWECYVRRRDNVYDHFTTNASSHELQFDGLDLSLNPSPATLTYGKICDELFPLDPSTGRNADADAYELLGDCIAYLRAPGDQWSAQNGFKWGPCMMLFHPVFADYNPSLTPLTAAPAPSATNNVVVIEKGYLRFPMNVALGEAQVYADGGAGLLGQADVLRKSIAHVPLSTPTILEQHVRSLVDAYKTPRQPDEEEVDKDGTPQIKAAYTALVQVHGTGNPILENDADLKDDNKGVYVKDGKLVAGKLVFSAYTRGWTFVEDYMTGPNRVKNGAYLVLELIARELLKPADDPHRPSPTALQAVAAKAGEAPSAAQLARVEELHALLDPVEATRQRLVKEKAAADAKDKADKEEAEKKLFEEAKAAKEKAAKEVAEKKRLADEKAAADAKDVAEKKRLADEKTAADAKEVAEKKRLADEKDAADAKETAEKKRLADEKTAKDTGVAAEEARLKKLAADTPIVVPFVAKNDATYWRLYDTGLKGEAVKVSDKDVIPAAWFSSTDPRIQKRLQAAVYVATGAGDANARRKALAISQINV